MLSLTLSRPTNSAYKVLCLGAHADDIEIGCGGTILRLSECWPSAEFHWIVFSANQERAVEARNSFENFLAATQQKQIRIASFRESFLPYDGAAVKEYFEEIKSRVSPDLIFTHYRNDLHQDHRLVSELTWNTFRDHLILEYEIPKYDGDLGSPNMFVHLEESICQKKIKYILDSFSSQSQKHWFERETFSSIMRLRGMESAAPDKYAEAFYCRKIITHCG
jgi:LmbE family N-acetylglucosaminyl deacetylase